MVEISLRTIVAAAGKAGTAGSAPPGVVPKVLTSGLRIANVSAQPLKAFLTKINISI